MTKLYSLMVIGYSSYPKRAEDLMNSIAQIRNEK